ncbi:hypothetical protein WICPIJ_005254 [Wickerhamomyces pijperi]|uniref:Uncharacterized protein n=1 Tax=Wickerhamomyces pijperi TaxID=599730 RepID=A0A9P8TM46_WICPI|nr:hypothetical protein WICPIJ_005254 [Wickerhamomyces pijperi]
MFFKEVPYKDNKDPLVMWTGYDGTILICTRVGGWPRAVNSGLSRSGESVEFKDSELEEVVVVVDSLVEAVLM